MNNTIGKLKEVYRFISISFLFFATTLFSQDSNFPMVYDLSFLKNSTNQTEESILLNNTFNEEILIVVEDILGNDLYSKVILNTSLSILQAKDPYNNIPSGVYTIVACARKELYNQKLVVD